MADPSTLPLPVTEDTTNLDGKRGSDTEVEGDKIDNKNESFIEQKALSEDKVQNAVKFLSHPRVRGSPVVHRRSFLEAKGLSKDEIGEAFLQVPDPPSKNFSGAMAATEGKAFVEGPKEFTSMATAPVVSTRQTTPQQLLPGVSSVVQARSVYSWSHLIFALGCFMAAGTGVGFLFKRYFLRKLKSWIRYVVLEDAATATFLPKMNNPGDKAAMTTAVAARAVSNAAAEITGASQEMIKMGKEERHYLGSVVQALEVHTRELTKAMMTMKMAMEVMAQSNGKRGSGSPLKQRQSIEVAHTTQKEGVEMHHGLEGANSKPPNSDQPPSVSRLQHRPKPWEIVRIENGNSLSRAYSSGVISENTVKSALVSNSWSEGDEASPMQQNYSSSSSDPGTSTVAPWWRQRKAEADLRSGHSWPPESTAKSMRVEVVIDNNETVVERSSPSSIPISKDGDKNTERSHSRGRHTGLVQPSIPQAPESVTAIKYQMGMPKDEMSVSSVLESPPVSMPIEVEHTQSLLNSHAVQISPPEVLSNESENVGMPSQLIQDHEQKVVASESI